MERIASSQPHPPPVSKHHSDMSDVGMDYPMYVYKPRRGMKRSEESKDTYKLPHRLIEKKRRDRINECITLGHLEKAVVLELTLKHVKALSSVLEQQQQKILALQNGLQIEQPVVNQEKSEEMFRSGFHMCAKEVLQYIANHETDRDFSLSHVINHLHKVATEVLQPPARPSTPSTPRSEDSPSYGPAQTSVEVHPRLGPPPKPISEGYVKNCVSVIQRAYATQSGEQSGSDTDTDSGYGGELEKGESRGQAGRPEYYSQEGHLKRASSDRQGSPIKQEDVPRHKRPRVESSEDELLQRLPHPRWPAPHPLCMPFYLIPPSAAAYLPMLEKCWYPGASIPMLYTPPAERPPRGDSPAPALKQVPPLNQETKE
uniref:Basic helix-loop-helix family member e40 n=1 Tax=Neogobius melanostomus TaxID=47308 RepID=A0A8C6SCX1_9GOBI